MDSLNILCCFCSNFSLSSLGLIASLFSLLISFLFLFKPRFRTELYICNHVVKEGTRLNFKIWNRNIFHNNILNIKCEITALRSNDNGEIVKTLKLKRENIICLRKGHNYTFYTTGDFRDIWLNNRHYDIYNKTNVALCKPCRPNINNIQIQNILNNPKDIETLYL